MSMDQDDEERRRRIAAKMEKIEALGGMFGGIADLPPEVAERFLDQVLAFESSGDVSVFDMLSENKVSLPQPNGLDDHAVTGHLWDVIRAMALLQVYIHSTDHLSDRELYAWLWGEALREAMVPTPVVPGFCCHIDVIGSGSDEDIEIWMRYYADDDSRRRWVEQWPGEPLPVRETPPFDRDRFLPQAETTEVEGEA